MSPRSPLVVKLKHNGTGKEFFFMVNHLYRGNGIDPRRPDQATVLNQWAKPGKATYYFLTRAGAGLRKRTKEDAKPGQMPCSTAALGCVLSVSPAKEPRTPTGATMTASGRTLFFVLFVSFG
jgi:hypothetical protein